MEEAGVKLIAEGANVYIGDLKSAENATNGFVDATEKGGGRISAAGSIITGALEKVGHIAVEAFGQALKATAAFIGDSVSLAGDFEAGMLNFQAVAGKEVDAKGLEEFRDLFLDIGKRLPVSTSEVQQAAVELIKGGIEPATVAAGGLESSIKFAAAAMDGDLAGAAEISAKIVGGWADVNATAADKALLMAEAQDTLTRAANASTVSVQDLSLGLFNVQGNAKLAGIGLDETVTALAVLAPNFSSAATAGTSLNAMIARMQPSTAPAKAAMAELGLFTEETGSAFYDAQGNFVGFEQAAQMLQDTTRNLTDAQRQQAFQTIFGMDAMGAAAELTRQGADGWRNMTAALSEANGVAENAATKQQGFNTALDNAKGSVEALQIIIGSALLPILTDLINNAIAPAINAVSDVADAFFDAGAGSVEFAMMVGDLASALGLPGDAITDLVFIIQDLIQYFDATVDSGDSLNDFLSDLPSGIRPVVQLIGDLIVFFQDGADASDDLGSAIDDLSGIWTKAGEVVSNVLSGYQDIIDSVLPQVQEFIGEHGDEISAFFQEAWDSIVEIISLALDLYNEIVPPVLHAIAGFIDEHGSEIQRILGAAWDTISTLISGVLDLIKGVITTTLALIRGDWEGAWTGIEGITNTIVGTIGGVIEGFLNIIAGFFDTSLGEIVNLWQNNWDMLVDIATQTDWARVGRDVVDGIISGLAGAWSSLVGWITDRVSGLVDAALAAVGASSPAKEFIPVGAFSVQGIMEGFSSMWPSLTKLVDSLGEDLIEQAKDLGMAVQNAIGDAFSSTASIDRQIARNLDSLADDVLPDYQEFTQGALKMAEQQARQFLDPTEGARFFKLRSDQILEFAKLQQDLAEAETSSERKRIQDQMNLINAAQTAELKAFESNLAGTESSIESIMASMQAFLASKGTNEKGDEVSLPGVLENGVIAAITGWLNQLTTPAANPWAMAGMNSSTTYNQQRQYTMPIYTNNSPEALQQSLALAGAMYP